LSFNKNSLAPGRLVSKVDQKKKNNSSCEQYMKLKTEKALNKLKKLNMMDIFAFTFFLVHWCL
jgi:hypothetical protein